MHSIVGYFTTADRTADGRSESSSGQDRQSVEREVSYSLAQLTTGTGRLMGTTFIIDDETRDQDERNDYIVIIEERDY